MLDPATDTSHPQKHDAHAVTVIRPPKIRMISLVNSSDQDLIRALGCRRAFLDRLPHPDNEDIRIEGDPIWASGLLAIEALRNDDDVSVANLIVATRESYFALYLLNEIDRRMRMIIAEGETLPPTVRAAGAAIVSEFATQCLLREENVERLIDIMLDGNASLGDTAHGILTGSMGEINQVGLQKMIHGLSWRRRQALAEALSVTRAEATKMMQQRTIQIAEVSQDLTRKRLAFEGHARHLVTLYTDEIAAHGNLYVAKESLRLLAARALWFYGIVSENNKDARRCFVSVSDPTCEKWSVWVDNTRNVGPDTVAHDLEEVLRHENLIRYVTPNHSVSMGLRDRIIVLTYLVNEEMNRAEDIAALRAKHPSTIPPVHRGDYR